MTEYAAQSNPVSLEELLKLADLYTNRVEQLAREEEAERKLPEKELVLWTAIAGIQFHVNLRRPEGQRLVQSLTPGTELVLRRDPKNKYDPWAVAVDTKEGQMLGFITRFKNETIARMMDHGHRFEARVEEMDEQEIRKIQDHKAATEQYHILPISVWLIK